MEVEYLTTNHLVGFDKYKIKIYSKINLSTEKHLVFGGWTLFM
jgi:hypothetical protein